MKKILFAILISIVSLEAKGLPEWYYKIKNYKEKKAKFIDYMLPLIKAENQKILAERDFIKQTFSKDFLVSFDNKLSQRNIVILTQLAKKYKISSIYNKKEFLKRINTVPVGLALAQAALESAWGNSRFVKLGNNIFGQWTWTQKNGIVPKDRAPGKTHMIRNFETIQDSIAAYMLNLNRNFAYSEFRDKRESVKPFTGVEASKTMIRYSEIGQEYVDRLVGMINKNNLLGYE
jgi:Bax protein